MDLPQAPSKEVALREDCEQQVLGVLVTVFLCAPVGDLAPGRALGIAWTLAKCPWSTACRVTWWKVSQSLYSCPSFDPYHFCRRGTPRPFDR